MWEAGKADSDTVMQWAASTTCFFGFLRVREMTVPSLNTYDSSAHLYFCDIVVDNLASPFIMEIWLKTSKTDLFRKEISVFVGCTDNELCSVSALLAYNYGNMR